MIAFTLFLLTFLFTYFLEPFEVYPPEHNIPYVWICFFRAVLVACIAFLYITVSHPKTNWSLPRRIFHVALFLLLIGSVNFFIRDFIYDNPNNWSFHFLLIEIRNAFLVGFFIFWLMLSLNHKLWIERAPIHAAVPNGSLSEGSRIEDPAVIHIQTQVKADDFLLSIENFILAKTEGNYTEIFTIETDGLHKQLKRIPLKSLEKQTSLFPWLLRTHRAYLINQKMVERTTGNAQGYQLFLKHYPEKVPVSRAFITSFKRYSAPH